MALDIFFICGQNSFAQSEMTTYTGNEAISEFHSQWRPRGALARHFVAVCKSVVKQYWQAILGKNNDRRRSIEYCHALKKVGNINSPS